MTTPTTPTSDGLDDETWARQHMAMLATDVVLFARDPADVLHVLLIERGGEPFAGSWALPGGLVDVDKRETFEAAARRELAEETGIAAPATLTRLGVYDAPDRDPRRRVIAVAFAGVLDELAAPHAADDAAAAVWVPWRQVDQLALAFDHAAIVADAHAATAEAF